MTTITLTGTRVDFVNGDTAAVGTDTAVLTMPSASSTFSYSIDYYDEGVPMVNVDEDLLQGFIAGLSLADLQSTDSIEAFIVTVEWSGNFTTILGLNWQTGPNTDSDLYFVLDGAALPSATSVTDWNNFDATITGLSLPTGSYAPGQNILWTDFDNYTITEDDELYGTNGRDILEGGIGDDYFYSSAGRDVYRGGAGFDQVTFGDDPNGVRVNLAQGTGTDGYGNTDKFVSIEMLRGSMHDDVFIGKAGTQIFRGLAGDDVMNGAKGIDMVRYDRDANYGGTSGVTVHLGKGTATDGFGDTDTLRNIENVRGSAFNDRLTGSKGKNVLEGGGGNDKLFGLAGNDELIGDAGKDRLDGGAGDDILTGGAHADIFVFSGAFGNDTITDFQTAGRAEKIDLSGVASIRSFRDLNNNHLSDVNGVAVIDDLNGNTITLEGHVAADFSANDFIF
ncbi:calcium-binding protein [Seohaeicola zhoushanensis]|uniref:Calcium-binding protein n=1 Tax=Seohaeicola zhoushanensis TaxID=1569283 RepID=A0A8J3M8E4_9RHOB|nr:calcium-binding protein [Seohaeicola zhoushanensis]GHF41824.1 hypothetical protein GCM10017056_11850 [Seohaeicola zhoushanensis]